MFKIAWNHCDLDLRGGERLKLVAVAQEGGILPHGVDGELLGAKLGDEDLEGAWKVHGRCMEGAWKVHGRFTEMGGDEDLL